VVNVIWHKGASPTSTDRSVVFTRWRPNVHPINLTFRWGRLACAQKTISLCIRLGQAKKERFRRNTYPTPLWQHTTHPVFAPTNSMQQGRHAAAMRAVATITVAIYYYYYVVCGTATIRDWKCTVVYVKLIYCHGGQRNCLKITSNSRLCVMLCASYCKYRPRLVNNFSHTQKCVA